MDMKVQGEEKVREAPDLVPLPRHHFRRLGLVAGEQNGLTEPGVPRTLLINFHN